MKLFSARSILIPVLVVVFSSCEVINPAEEIPSYLYIPEITFKGNAEHSDIQGAQKISDVWISVDGRIQGIYELPALIPVLKNGASRIDMNPGVIVNGISNTRIAYPFFKSYRTNIYLEPGKTDTLYPVTFYDSAAYAYPVEGQGSFPEGFEGVGNVLRLNSASKVDTIFKTDVDSLVFDGNYSCLFELNSTHDYLYAETNKSYSLPGKGRTVFVEFNYRSDVLFEVGLYGDDDAVNKLIPLLNLVPTNNEWKKIYISLTTAISYSEYTKFNLFIKSNYSGSATSERIVLDNLKIIYQ